MNRITRQHLDFCMYIGSPGKDISEISDVIQICFDGDKERYLKEYLKWKRYKENYKKLHFTYYAFYSDIPYSSLKEQFVEEKKILQSYLAYLTQCAKIYQINDFLNICSNTTPMGLAFNNAVIRYSAKDYDGNNINIMVPPAKMIFEELGKVIYKCKISGIHIPKNYSKFIRYPLLLKRYNKRKKK